ncbi:DUF2778 domain-containing protein [Cupriavidus campinensis]
MLECSFELNGKEMSELRCGALSFPAFSGLPEHVNQPQFACHPNSGPIPKGTYYIFDREIGGVLGPFRKMFGRKSDWFALYAIDKKIDDVTYCNAVERSNFRLHPKVGTGISRGCITIESSADFYLLRALLKNQRPVPVPGTTLKAYGRVVVK